MKKRIANKDASNMKPELDMQKASFNYSKSIITINDGKGRFTIQPFPMIVQLSSVNAIQVTDINGDAKADIILGKNMFGFPPQFGRLDASYGHLLINDG